MIRSLFTRTIVFLYLILLGFSIVYLEMDNENVYSFTHSFVSPLAILLSIFSLDIYFHSVHLVCRPQMRQTLPASTLEFKEIIYMKMLFNIKFNFYNTQNWVSKTSTKLPVVSYVLYSNI